MNLDNYHRRESLYLYGIHESDQEDCCLLARKLLSDMGCQHAAEIKLEWVHIVAATGIIAPDPGEISQLQGC